MSILPAQSLTGNRDIADAASRRQLLGMTAARELESAALTQGDAEALAVADMLRESACPDNIFTAQDLSNADGVLFDGFGSLTASNSRLDPAYMAQSSRRAAKRAAEALNRCKPESGELLRLLTLTMPKIGAGFKQTMDVLQTALVLLKKRQWFKRNVRGAVFGVQTTLGAAGDHWHAHAHILAWSKWIVWAALGEQWTDCLKSAARKHGVTFQLATEHSRAICDVRLITSRGRGPNTVKFSEAVRRVCGYIVRGSDFERVPQAQRCDVERVLYRCRLIETFGECNSQRGKLGKSALSYVHIQNITDGTDPVKDVTDRKSPSTGRTKRERKASLRELGAEMIRRGNRSGWLELLKLEYQKRRAWRRRQLSTTHPFGIFRTLDGRVWYGEKISVLTTLSYR